MFNMWMQRAVLLVTLFASSGFVECGPTKIPEEQQLKNLKATGPKNVNDLTSQVHDLEKQLAEVENVLRAAKAERIDGDMNGQKAVQGPGYIAANQVELSGDATKGNGLPLNSDDEWESYSKYHTRERGTGWQPVKRMVGFQPMKRQNYGYEDQSNDGFIQSPSRRMVGFQPMRRSSGPNPGLPAQSQQEDPIQYTQGRLPQRGIWEPVGTFWNNLWDKRRVGFQPVRRSANPTENDVTNDQLEKEVLYAIESHLKSDLDSIQRRFGIKPETILRDLRARNNHVNQQYRQ